ncbi:MAG: bifunctional phosphoribosylaminoimidazolecarboxamide formyltransferase/IMP cyclohydrolase [Acidobacteria bacterium RIFCSPLOWO2_02_FULL_61_28]|nr:MAG: bifunctional phosphoribosylaminoimidazolecarboxamide formyltransferase/IMP cyclohydrolase [Acidobacteria bacterium RIFCSPLOWO2_02_FULL_61_28]
MSQISRAVISVTNKTGVIEFARGLRDQNVEILSTGGTGRLLREAGIAVKDVAEVTGLPEMLDGRVKTLHPVLHAGILARRDNPEHRRTLERQSIGFIDMVVVNLYPFEEVAARPQASFAELIENIDIGGPTMIRAAAKNFQDVAVVTAPEDYAAILDEMQRCAGQLSRETLWSLAQKAFAYTARYDSAITRTLSALDHTGATIVAPERALFPERLEMRFDKLSELRYGENPHQKAALYAASGNQRGGLARARQLQGKELSFNNLVDLEAAWSLVREFSEPATAIIKHTNPCGCSAQPTLAASYLRAYETDTVSAFGSVIGFNHPLDAETAEHVAKLFVEAIVAPGYSREALERLAGKKNLRLVEVDRSVSMEGELHLEQVSGGLLIQEKDRHVLRREDLKTVTVRQPTEEQIASLLFAWKVAKHVKSNAIVFARDGQVVGVGAGQMSRVDSVRLGASKSVLPLAGTVLASDAFFPFPDGVEEAAKAGVVAVIQPGGSIRDQEVIDAANRLGLAMVFTGVRHFWH